MSRRRCRGTSVIFATSTLLPATLAGVPPISLVLAADKERYISHLTSYRFNSAEAGGRMFSDAANESLGYFAVAARLRCERAAGFEEGVAHIQAS